MFNTILQARKQGLMATQKGTSQSKDCEFKVITSGSRVVRTLISLSLLQYSDTHFQSFVGAEGVYFRVSSTVLVAQEKPLWP